MPIPFFPAMTVTVSSTRVNRRYSKEEIEKVLREKDFEYQRVALPFGLATPGQDRSATRDLIFPSSLAGKSVLDIGCALGYFCFEAEARGAIRVVGTEVKANRLEQAMLLKEIKGSNVEFLLRDINAEPLDEEFDYVCLLNVIHHVQEPIRLLRRSAALTRERLIIEFPTFDDPRFKKETRTCFASLWNRFPLIGVNPLPPPGETFVFSPLALKAILSHERLFRSIDLVPSPTRGRAIAICVKSTAS